MGGAKKKSRPEAHERPECPWQFQHIWRWFFEVLNGCPSTGMGPVTIGWRDLQAWCEMTGERPELWETKLLMRLSVLRANIEIDEQNKAAKPKGGR